MAVRRNTRSQRFLRLIAEHPGEIVVLAHSNPDPDAIASGWAVVTLLQHKLDRQARLVAGGAIVRSENLRMVELLAPPIQLCSHISLEGNPGVVLVDCNPSAGNHLLHETNCVPLAVIDHHEAQGRPIRVRHRDVRCNVAATATIVTQYLREQGVVPTRQLATALIYAIHTDALDWPVFTRLDQRALSWLHEHADLNKLAEIQSAPLSRAYYSDLLLALETTSAYDNAALCFLPRAAGPEIVGEVADLLIRAEPFDRVLCAAVIEGDILLSVRTTPAGGHAADMVGRLLVGVGQGGGHSRRAGGRIAAPQSVEDAPTGVDTALRDTLRQRWLKLCEVDESRGGRLVARREILEHL